MNNKIKNIFNKKYGSLLAIRMSGIDKYRKE